MNPFRRNKVQLLFLFCIFLKALVFKSFLDLNWIFSWIIFINTLGITEADLAGALDVNPSLHQEEVEIEAEPVDLVITGNVPKENTSPLITPKYTSDEPLSDLDFIASKSTQ